MTFFTWKKLFQNQLETYVCYWNFSVILWYMNPLNGYARVCVYMCLNKNKIRISLQLPN